MPKHSRILNPIAAILGAAFILTGTTSDPRAESPKVRITFVKARHAPEGFGNLFYAGERYRLQIKGIPGDSLQSSRLDLAGTVENIHNASDILGTYGPAEPGGSTLVENGKPVRIRNKSGAILDVHGANFGGQSLNLAGLTVTSRGWGPDSKERVGR